MQLVDLHLATWRPSQSELTIRSQLVAGNKPRMVEILLSLLAGAVLQPVPNLPPLPMESPPFVILES